MPSGGKCRLTSNIVGSIQNYYGQSISSNIGNLKATQCTQGPSEENFETLHSFCPAGPKHEVSPSLIKSMEPIFIIKRIAYRLLFVLN